MSHIAIRVENVDGEDRLRNLAAALSQVQRKHGCQVICSLHPGTRHKMQEYSVGAENDQVRYLTSLGLFDFVALERSAWCMLSDSGTVQEECCLFRVPTVTLRDVTERPETLEVASEVGQGTTVCAVLPVRGGIEGDGQDPHPDRR